MFAKKKILLSTNQNSLSAYVVEHDEIEIKNLLHMNHLKGFYNSYFSLGEYDIHTTIFEHVDDHFSYDTVGEKYELLKKIISFKYPYIVYENKDNRFKDKHGRTVNIIKHFYEVAYKGQVFEVCVIKSAHFPGDKTYDFNQVITFYATDMEYEGRRNKLQNCVPIEVELKGDDEAQDLLYESTQDQRVFSFQSLGEHLGNIVIDAPLPAKEVNTVYKPELDIERLRKVLELRKNSNGNYEFEPGEFFDLIEHQKIPAVPFKDAFHYILSENVLKPDSQLYMMLTFMLNSKENTMNIRPFFGNDEAMEERVPYLEEEAERINEFLGYKLISVDKSNIYV